jgi:molybdopterin-guanine dinucleotide biosynthesis protein A
MGGEKPLRLWRGRRLIDRAVELASGYGRDVAIAARTEDQIAEAPATPVLDAEDIHGPLAGLESAISFAVARGAPYVLTIPCDAPLLPPDLAHRLSAAIEDESQCAVARSGGQLHPDCALWSASLGPALRAYHAAGHASLRGFAEGVGMTIVDWDGFEIDPFSNANTPEQLAALQ